MHHQSLSGQWTFRQLNTTEWLPAAVPGGVHTDLLALGKIPDPFVADNEKKVHRRRLFLCGAGYDPLDFPLLNPKLARPGASPISATGYTPPVRFLRTSIL